jgi:hypothetical protein
MKTEFCQNPTNLHLSFKMSLFVFSSAWLWNCKNAFCQGILPPEEVTIVCPPSGDPDIDPHKYWLLLPTLYGLRCSPWHWYDKTNAILQSIGLTPSLEDPCLYSGSLLTLPILLAVLLGSRVWKDVNWLGTRDWNLMPYSSLVITVGQKHTHTHTIRFFSFSWSLC